jgi:GAF domain-containing protein
LPLAWLVTTYREPHHFTLEDERYMTTLADSAAAALDNRYLFDSTDHALKEASTLYQASRAITAASQPGDILRAVTDYLLHEDAAHVFIVLLQGTDWGQSGVNVDVVANWSDDDSVVNLEGMIFSQETFPAWTQLSTPELLVIPDVDQDDSLGDQTRAGLGSLNTQSLVVMPLRVGTRDIGAIWLGSPVAHHYSERDLRMYQAFAEQTSIAINAAQLYDQTERRAGQLQISAKVSQAASSILDLDNLLPRVVDLIRDAFHYDHVQVFLMDRDDRYAVLRASTGEAGRQLLSISHKLEKGSASVIGSVTAENKPVVASDTGLGDVVHRPNPYLPHTRSELALPLAIKGQVVGAIDVQSNRPNAFNEEDVSVLTTLAAQISVAIDNARLFEQAEHRANDMSLLFEVTTAAAAAENLNEALQNVANDLRD